jgi:hypothetical protein
MVLLTPHHLQSANEETGLRMKLDHLFREVRVFGVFELGFCVGFLVQFFCTKNFWFTFLYIYFLSSIFSVSNFYISNFCVQFLVENFLCTVWGKKTYKTPFKKLSALSLIFPFKQLFFCGEQNLFQ